MDNLTLKVGARVALNYNVNTIDGLVNGAQGKVVGYERTETGAVKCVIVAFDDPTVGANQRLQYPVIAQKYAKDNGTPILRQDFQYQIPYWKKNGYSHGASVKILQFPLKLAWASTAHKMQVRFYQFRQMFGIEVFPSRAKLLEKVQSW